MSKAKYSFEDKARKGLWWIACSECQRGGNGEKSCACGHNVKRGGIKGCFSGTLLSTLKGV